MGPASTPTTTFYGSWRQHILSLLGHWFLSPLKRMADLSYECHCLSLLSLNFCQDPRTRFAPACEDVACAVRLRARFPRRDFSQ